MDKNLVEIVVCNDNSEANKARCGLLSKNHLPLYNYRRNLVQTKAYVMMRAYYIRPGLLR